MVGNLHRLDLVQLRVQQSLDLIESDDVENLADTVAVLVEDSRTELSKPFVLGRVNGVPNMSNKVLELGLRYAHASNAILVFEERGDVFEERGDVISDFRQTERVLGFFD